MRYSSLATLAVADGSIEPSKGQPTTQDTYLEETVLHETNMTMFTSPSQWLTGSPSNANVLLFSHGHNFFYPLQAFGYRAVGIFPTNKTVFCNVTYVYVFPAFPTPFEINRAGIGLTCRSFQKRLWKPQSHLVQLQAGIGQFGDEKNWLITRTVVRTAFSIPLELGTRTG